MARTGKVLQEAGQWLDLTSRFALTFMGVLGHITDHDERGHRTGLLDGLVSAATCHQRQRQHQRGARGGAAAYEASGASRTGPAAWSSSRLLRRPELVEPGVVLVADWRPDPGTDRGPEYRKWAASGASHDPPQPLNTP